VHKICFREISISPEQQCYDTITMVRIKEKIQISYRSVARHRGPSLVASSINRSHGKTVRDYYFWSEGFTLSPSSLSGVPYVPLSFFNYGNTSERTHQYSGNNLLFYILIQALKLVAFASYIFSSVEYNFLDIIPSLVVDKKRITHE